ncbi:S1/P1 nuclease [Pseudoduganella ginsengisoli]|uniref:Phospholipase n=1 Tax=Pseudoduganella ginsengisoli TaxID=1462440 RepID=A0A6L6PWN3_9BURK|nr:S1/P1 nuclease [Pseudoduganella ginsengisoli]MTW01835.1 phospholipase [Pseudoduganella ginsengisoli]
MRLAAVVIAGAALCAAPGAHAWGNDGHRAVGAMADQLIRGTNAEKQVRALLLPGESLEKIAVWMDCAKGAVCGAPTQEMADYVKANPQHAEYHYANLPFQALAYQPRAVGANGSDIVQSMRQAIWVLQGKDGAAVNPHRFTRRQALLLLAHLAGDMHQPLHVGNAYLDKNGAYVVPVKQEQVDDVAVFSTAGGNALLLDGNRSLHNYWDFALVDYAMRRVEAQTPEQFARVALAAKPAMAEFDGDPAEWAPLMADEALAMSKRAHAGLKIGPVQAVPTKETKVSWQVAAPDDYAVTASAIVKEQLAKGGIRLAAILQAIWP